MELAWRAQHRSKGQDHQSRLFSGRFGSRVRGISMDFWLWESRRKVSRARNTVDLRLSNVATEPGARCPLDTGQTAQPAKEDVLEGPLRNLLLRLLRPAVSRSSTGSARCWRSSPGAPPPSTPGGVPSALGRAVARLSIELAEAMEVKAKLGAGAVQGATAQLQRIGQALARKVRRSARRSLGGGVGAEAATRTGCWRAAARPRGSRPPSRPRHRRGG